LRVLAVALTEGTKKMGKKTMAMTTVSNIEIQRHTTVSHKYLLRPFIHIYLCSFFG
jgi:hypothetical protein